MRMTGGTVRRAPVFFIVLSLLASPLVRAETGWLDAYRKGVAEREAGRCPSAAYYFLEALRENPDGGRAVKVDAVTTMDYLPRLMLADCLCRMGEKELAGKHLAQASSEKSMNSKSAAELAQSVQRCLAVKTPPAVPPQREEILKQVQTRCGLPEGQDKTLYPWYFDYEVSQEFLKRGEYDAGVQYLYRALDKKAAPQEKTRLYGMWFADYHPYFLLAKAFYHLGSDECALRALEQSVKTEDLKSSSEDLKERERMRKELEALPPNQ